MTVAADNCHAGLREAKFRSDDVNDTARRAIDSMQRDAKCTRIFFQLMDLFCRQLIGNHPARKDCRDAVIDCRNRFVWTPNGELTISQSCECLRRRHLMNKVKIDVQNCRRFGFLRNNMRIPDFFN